MSSKRKQKQVSLEEYVQTYCQEKRIRKRHAVYVSPEVSHNLKMVAGLFNEECYTTASSLADAILLRHFSEHRELIKRRLDETYRNKPLVEDEPAEDRQDDTDSESCPDDDSED
jgi:hypothetical protein